ncbi:MAG TPA: hypothetical protein VJ353_01620 [Xanthobacteraceae bacterium]|nr:hypothetical protein [Xanthobacteraceae bacterium]
MKLHTDFARQPVVSSAIASLALAQEDGDTHPQLFGKANDLFAVLLDRFAAGVGARRGVADFDCAGGNGIGKSQGFGRAARNGAGRVVLLSDGRRRRAE